ncbi:MAG: hypothetical protein KDB26_15045 [Microthrixaceae bacterium]|nr:hypothetical protein [Microthrixaceae bacterium]
MNAQTTTITPLDMAAAYESARFDAQSGWVGIHGNAWLHTVEESREYVGFDLLADAGLSDEEAREAYTEFSTVNEWDVLMEVCAHIRDHAKPVAISTPSDEDEVVREYELEIEALRLAEVVLDGDVLPKLIDGAVREQLAPELPSVLAAIGAKIAS